MKHLNEYHAYAQMHVVSSLTEPTTCHVTFACTSGSLDQLHAFELHFTRQLAQRHTLPDVPTDLDHARNV